MDNSIYQKIVFSSTKNEIMRANNKKIADINGAETKKIFLNKIKNVLFHYKNIFFLGGLLRLTIFLLMRT